MADEKPFDATTAKLARARRDGDLPRSSEINAVASVACASFVLFGILGVVAAAAREALVRAAAGSVPSGDVPHDIARHVQTGPYVVLGGAVFAVVAAALLGAVGATFAQARALTVKFPAPKLDKLNPFAGLKRMFSRDAVVSGAKALVVASAVAGCVVPAAREAFAAVGGNGDGAALASLVVRALRSLFASALAVAALFAIGDFGLENAKWRKRLRMTFDEIKRDSKSSDGDPLVRGRRRAAHRALVRGSIGRVADATFVVTNPTHVAIALEYRPPEIAVPRILVRAIDAGAREVKRRALELRVPIVENVPLARALLHATDVGDVIPPEAYVPVAAIVAMLARTGALR